MRLRRLLFVVLALVAGALLWLARPWPLPREMEFRPLADVRPDGKNWDIKVRFAPRVVDPAAEYPASFGLTFDDFQCSATLVGPHALLTAGHCIEFAAEAGQKLTVRVGAQKIDLTCAALGALGANDIGLCKLSESVKGRLADVIAQDANLVKQGATVRLTGWADSDSSRLVRWLSRITSRLGFGNDFRTGTGTVAKSEALLWVDGNMGIGGDVVIENGDSGGAAYAEQGRSRSIIGVNHCGGPGCGRGATEKTTRLVNLTDPNVAQWMLGWASQNHTGICGLTTTSGCQRQ